MMLIAENLKRDFQNGCLELMTDNSRLLDTGRYYYQ